MDVNYKDIKILKRGQTNIYCLVDPISNLIRYVGKSDDTSIRLKEHIRKSKDSKTHKNNWIQSLLKKGLRPEILILDTVDVCEWEYWEKYWIDQIKNWGFNLTNIAEGGRGGNLGDIVNKKISDSKLGFKHSNETKNKIREFRTGSNHTEKTIKLFKETRNGKNNPMYGKKRPESSKKYKEIIQLSLNGDEIKIWDGITIASKELKINRSSITDVCYGRHKSAGGYKWKLID